VTTSATLERRRLADALLEVGPDADTLCEGWSARDLAAHTVLRDRRPDAALGIVVGRFAGYTERVQRRIAGGDWDDLVAQVRSGPPIFYPTRIPVVDRWVNTIEFFVHHEDVRRAQPDWSARPLDDDLADDLYGALRRSAKLFARRAPAGLVLEPDAGRPRITAKDAATSVVVRGPVGELVLWIYGRRDHTGVSYDGPDDAVAAMRAASFGF
jgi:uncharacterized protein (TIGR03085 family)